MRSRLLVAIALTTLCAATPAAAAVKTFVGTGVADWLDGNNWSPAGVPGPTDDAQIAAGTAFLSGATQVETVTVSGGGRLSLIGGTLTPEYAPQTVDLVAVPEDPTATPTNSATATATDTPTTAPTPTTTAAPTDTPTTTPTDTPTTAPTGTPTTAPTSTATTAPTETPTVTPTATDTAPTDTPTVTPTATTVITPPPAESGCSLKPPGAAPPTTTAWWLLAPAALGLLLRRRDRGGTGRSVRLD